MPDRDEEVDGVDLVELDIISLALLLSDAHCFCASSAMNHASPTPVNCVPDVVLHVVNKLCRWVLWVAHSGGGRETEKK